MYRRVFAFVNRELTLSTLAVSFQGTTPPPYQRLANFFIHFAQSAGVPAFSLLCSTIDRPTLSSNPPSLLDCSERTVSSFQG